MLVAGMLIGGLGLFLLAVNMITEGLKLAAGSALKDILARYTSTAPRGVLSGILVTGLVQSSSAVTVATIGFVNAGLLTLPQSLGVIYGANVGTTMTGWLVAAVGFNLELETLALPLVGIGALATLAGRSRRIGAAGEAIAGFGLFFIGIDVLQGAFQGLTGAVDVAAFALEGLAGVLVHVLFGTVLTLLSQSSSAAMALILTAVSGGALGLDAGAAMVVGANIGTTSTATLAVIGATANARRVAAAHVIFNAVTGVAALALLRVLVPLAQTAADWAGSSEPAIVLALFHTTFNVLGVVLMWPFTTRLAGILANRFVTPAEALARPAYLDRTVLVTPELAVEALKRELLRAMTLTRDAAVTAISSEGPLPRPLREQLHGVQGLLDAIDGFVARLEVGRLPPGQADQLPLLLRISNYLEDVASLAESLQGHRGALEAVSRPPVAEAVGGFQAQVVAQLGRCRPDAGDFDRTALNDAWQALEQGWHDLKTRLLEAASRRSLPLSPINGALEGLRSALRMAEQLSKAALRMDALMPSAAAEHSAAAAD